MEMIAPNCRISVAPSAIGVGTNRQSISAFPAVIHRAVDDLSFALHRPACVVDVIPTT